jgi:carboxyl-terminal processing protease
VTRRFAAGFALGFAVAIVAARWFGDPEHARAAPDSRLDRPAFSRVVDTVLDRYVDPIADEELFARGLKHMLAGLDTHSHYMTAGERKALKQRAKGGTSGLTVALESDVARERSRRLEVLAVAPGSPADAAGLEPGDHVLRVRDRNAADLLSQAEADGLLAGAIGEEIELVVQERNAAGARQVDLVLAKADGETVEGALVTVEGGKVAVVVIRRFASGTGEATKREIAALRRSAGKALRAVVIDLRGNPGGEIDEALVVADLFVHKGVLTRTRGRGGRILREETAHAAGTDTSTPLRVLQDRHSASASELLAAALQENGRARVIGERSYGKGTVQEVIGLDDGSVLALTIARYYSPKDHLIDGAGVAPDVVARETDPASGDEALAAALDDLGLSRPR